MTELPKPYSNNANGKSSFTRNDGLYLVFLIVIGTTIRIIYHHNRPFIGDEVGTLIYMRENVGFILSHFESWLTMNYFILAEKILSHSSGYNKQILTLIPEVAGIATIPLTAILAEMFTTKRIALISATLVTMNAYLIAFSGVIRSYSLLTAFSLVVIIFFFKWFSNRTYKNGIYVSLACYFLMLSHLNGAYTLAYILFITGIETFYSIKRRKLSAMTTLFIPLSVSIFLTAVSYMELWHAISIWGIPWHDDPPTSIAYIPYLFSQYFAKGYYGWLSAILMISGILLAYKREKSILILIPNVVLSILLVSIQGISHFPWAYSRFLIFLLPICIIFIAEGIQWYAEMFSQRANIIGIALTVLTIVTWMPLLKNNYDRKINYPWDQVASFIKSSSDIDMILHNSYTDSLNLQPYFFESGHIRLQLPELSKMDHTKVKGDKIFFVISDKQITTDYPVTTFGDIQVITYPADNYADQLTMIRDDLLKSIHVGEVSPLFTDIYKNIWTLNNKLGLDEQNNHLYYDLYIRCFLLTERQRNMPIPLQYWELQHGGYQILEEN